MTRVYDVAVLQNQGRRNYQEDYHSIAILDDQDANLIIVADGMGGHAAGDVASRSAVEAFQREFKDGIESPLRTQLNRALFRANNALKDQLEQNPDYSGMGCTLIGAVFRPGSLRWVSVGDSIIYLVRDGKVMRINADHSLAPQIDAQVLSGDMTEDEARNHPDRSALVSALMGKKMSLVDLPEEELALQEGDWVILASDGIETLEPGEVAGLVEQNSAVRASDMVHLLMQAVLDCNTPDQDNVTIAAVKIDEPSEAFVSTEARNEDVAPQVPAYLNAEAEVPVRTSVQEPRKKSKIPMLFFFALLLLIAFASWAFLIDPEGGETLKTKILGSAETAEPVDTVDAATVPVKPTADIQPALRNLSAPALASLRVKVDYDDQGIAPSEDALIAISLRCTGLTAGGSQTDSTGIEPRLSSAPDTIFTLIPPAICENATRILSAAVVDFDPKNGEENILLTGAKEFSGEIPATIDLTLKPYVKRVD